MSEPYATPRLSLGAIPYLWERDRVLEFYEEVAVSPVDIVYLGETVCPKRRQLRLDDWLALAERLAAAGKTPVLSTLTLIEAGSELGALRSLCRESRFAVEANDMAAAGILEGLEKDFVAGPALNLYNGRALARMRDAGAIRWVLPVEMGVESAAPLVTEFPDMEAEVLAWGRLPLAWSARCFTARAEGRSRDDCGFVCGADPDGRLMRTQEGEPFLALNGIQTQSALTHCLAKDYQDVLGTGVGVLRIMPQGQHTSQIVEAFDRLRQGAEPSGVAEELESLAPVAVCNGYWHGQAAFEMIGP